MFRLMSTHELTSVNFIIIIILFYGDTTESDYMQSGRRATVSPPSASYTNCNPLDLDGSSYVFEPQTALAFVLRTRSER